MKTKWTTSGNAYRFFPLIAVILTIACISCDKTENDHIEGRYFEELGVITEFFHVYPSGSDVMPLAEMLHWSSLLAQFKPPQLTALNLFPLMALT
jgi:hypothetical protein